MSPDVFEEADGRGDRARAGGARVLPGALRVTFWGVLAMGLTTCVGTLFGHVV